MEKILLTTESGSDISGDLKEKYRVHVVPFGINFPDHSAPDVEVDVQEVYDFYKKTRKIPKTNAVSPYQYTQFFDSLQERYPDAEIIHIGYSSACSCSFQNAVLGVRDCVKARVHLIDSLNVSGGLANLVYAARRIIDANPQDSAEELVKKIEPFVAKIKMAFVPDRLDFLAAGGRVSNAAALGASILKIKPRIDIVKGELIAGKKYKGLMKRVAPQLAEDFCGEYDLDKSRIYLFYAEGADLDVIENVRQLLLSKGFAEVPVQKLGCVMTVHGGKGAIGISGTLKG